MSKAKCMNCRDVIESKHVHDRVSCSCRKRSDNVAQRFSELLSAVMKSEGEQLSHHQICCVFEEVIGTGFSLDGGDEYVKVLGKQEHYRHMD